MTYCATTLMLICSAGEPAKPLAELAKEESPEAMVKEWAIAMIKGDEQTVKAAFDASTEEGQKTAAVAQLAARLMKASAELKQAAKKKYGDAGVQAVEAALHVKLGDTDGDKIAAAEKAIREDEAKVFFSKDGTSAVVRGSGANKSNYTELAKKDGRWFIVPDSNVKGAEFAAGIQEQLVKKEEKAKEIVDASKTVDEMRRSLDELEKSLMPKLQPKGGGEQK